MLNANDSLMNGTKRVRKNSFFLRIKQEYFQPKNGTITRIFSLGRKNNFLIYKTSVSHESLVVAFERSINDTCI